MLRKVIVLGSTGSIGTAALELMANEPERFRVSGLACRGNVDLLNAQIEHFRPDFVSVYDGGVEHRVVAGRAKLLTGMDGMREMIRSDADIVLNALPGSIGLEPTLEVLRSGKTLALANKESLVMAGRLIAGMVASGPSGGLIPVDSEHSALHQLLKSVPRNEVKGIAITASGGPFREHSKEALAKVTLAEALNHPTWKMGNKITIDSATLMNKGLEVVEARWLFDMDPRDIRVLVHPESIVHGVVEMADGAFLAHMAYPDMRIPIAYALNGEKRHPSPFRRPGLENLSMLTFSSPDMDRFPCLRLAFDALEVGDSALVVMNAANEVASMAFVNGRIRFTDIPVLIEEALEHHPRALIIENTEIIWELQKWAEEFTEGVLRKSYD